MLLAVLVLSQDHTGLWSLLLCVSQYTDTDRAKPTAKVLDLCGTSSAVQTEMFITSPTRSVVGSRYTTKVAALMLIFSILFHLLLLLPPHLVDLY